MRENYPPFTPEEPKPSNLPEISQDGASIGGGGEAVRPGVVRRKKPDVHVDPSEQAHQQRLMDRAIRNAEAGGEYLDGRALEKALFGSMRTNDPDYLRDIARVTERVPIKGKPGEFDETPRGEFYEVLPVVKKFQSWDPRDPGTAFLKKLRLRVGELLKLTPAQMDRLGGYSALQSPLDRWNGTDGMLLYSNVGSRDAVVRMDASLADESDPRKQELRHKPDIYLGAMPDPRTKASDFEAYVNDVADRAAKLLGRELGLEEPRKPLTEG